MPPTASSNSVIGSLTTTDGNAADTFVYSVVGGTHAALFGISGANLVFVNAGQTGNTLQVTVRVTDSGGRTLDSTFVVDEGGVMFRCVI